MENKTFLFKTSSGNIEFVAIGNLRDITSREIIYPYVDLAKCPWHDGRIEVPANEEPIIIADHVEKVHTALLMECFKHFGYVPRLNYDDGGLLWGDEPKQVREFCNEKLNDPSWLRSYGNLIADLTPDAKLLDTHLETIEGTPALEWYDTGLGELRFADGVTYYTKSIDELDLIEAKLALGHTI